MKVEIGLASTHQKTAPARPVTIWGSPTPSRCKVQGSSFRKVIIPIQRTRLLDRSLVYTAITRATDLAVLVGASETLRQALERDAHASGARRR